MASQAADEAHFVATATALDTLTDQATSHSVDPKKTLHLHADKENGHSFMKKIFPSHCLDDLENKFHMGNYVIDRQTGQKVWEPMSIYVRVGMHALYYGSEQEKALHWKRTLDLLKNQSVKMGKEYDDPKSVDHIRPFIESFNLQDSMSQMVISDPAQYKTFNEFFAREIREDARPPQEPQDVSDKATI